MKISLIVYFPEAPALRSALTEIRLGPLSMLCGLLNPMCIDGLLYKCDYDVVVMKLWIANNTMFQYCKSNTKNSDSNWILSVRFLFFYSILYL